MFDVAYNKSETCNWEFHVVTPWDDHMLKVRPLNTHYAKELSKPLLYPVEQNAINFEEIDIFLIDLTNSCNLRCPFCYSSPQRNSVKLTDFDYQIISIILHKLKNRDRVHRMQVGCDFEPLLSDKFESYGEAFRDVFKGPDTPEFGIMTNGLLLDANKLKYYWDAFGKKLYIRISFHSHKKEVFTSYIKGLNFDRLVNNIIDVRKQFPGVRIELCNVLTKPNFTDIPGYLDYVFNSLKVDIVHFRRAHLWHLSDDKRTKLEFERRKFVELGDWLSNSDSYNVSIPVCYSTDEFSVSVR